MSDKNPVITDRVNLRRRLAGLDLSPVFEPYSGVELVIDKDTSIFAGTHSGRVLTIDCPWGTRAAANNILRDIQAYQYQPMEVSGALMDPAAELMDGISADNVYGGIMGLDIQFGVQYVADVSSPEDEEVDHEFPYIAQKDRKIRREFAGVASELRIQHDLIQAEVKAREEGDRELSGRLSVEADRITAEVKARTEADGQLSSRLDVHADQIAAKVSKSGGDGSGSFGWLLESDHWRIESNGSEVFRVDRYGAYVAGEIRAKTGRIGDFVIENGDLSYNQEWGGYNSRGVYLGTSGLQLGSWDSGFHVDSYGHLYAESGEFRGTVQAGSIDYGGNAGYFDGAGLSSHSVGGGEIGWSSVGTSHVTGGINTSLGYADYAYGIVCGWESFGSMAGQFLGAQQINLEGHRLGLSDIYYKGQDDKAHYLRVVTW